MPTKNKRLSHLDRLGQARMVDVGAKPETVREAIARGFVALQPETLRLIRDSSIPKGDVFAAARVAGIMAAKRTPELIPLCHPLRITGVDIEFVLDPKRSTVTVEARVRTVDKTGVEMEALTAVSIALLTIYDMCKAIDKGMTFGEVGLLKKSGGKSGTFIAPSRDERARAAR